MLRFGVRHCIHVRSKPNVTRRTVNVVGASPLAHANTHGDTRGLARIVIGFLRRDRTDIKHILSALLHTRTTRLSINSPPPFLQVHTQRLTNRETDAWRGPSHKGSTRRHANQERDRQNVCRDDGDLDVPPRVFSAERETEKNEHERRRRRRSYLCSVVSIAPHS